MSKYVSLAAAAAVAAGLSFGATNAEAGLVSVTASEEDWEQNDCSGQFGQGFENCQVAGSYVIAKYDVGEDDWTINDARFPGVTEDDFDVVEDPDGTWTWDYFNTDWDIRYWVAKVGQGSDDTGGFTLFWEVFNDPAVCQNGTFDLNACLALALVIDTGTFLGDNLSHLTFYDTPSTVPLPAGLLLFMTGLAGVGFLGRYKTKRRKLELV